MFSLPSAGPAGRREQEALDDGDRARVERSLRFIRDRGAYLQLLATQPRTVAHALTADIRAFFEGRR